MQSIRVLLVLFTVVRGTSAVSGMVHIRHLRSGPSPAPTPMASPGPAPELTPEAAVEEAHHTTAVSRGEYIVDKAGHEHDKAHVMSSKAAKFVAETSGDEDGVKAAKEKIVEQQAQVKKSDQETQESKEAFKAAKSAYQHAELAAENAAEPGNAKTTVSKETVVNGSNRKNQATPVSLEAGSFAQIKSNVAKKGVGFDGFGMMTEVLGPEPSDQRDDDGSILGSTSNQNGEDNANRVSDDVDDDDIFVGVAKKGIVFDGFGRRDPSNQNDDGDDRADDDSFLQISSKRFLAKMGQIRKKLLAKAIGPH